MLKHVRLRTLAARQLDKMTREAQLDLARCTQEARTNYEARRKQNQVFPLPEYPIGSNDFSGWFHGSGQFRVWGAMSYRTRVELAKAAKPLAAPGGLYESGMANERTSPHEAAKLEDNGAIPSECAYMLRVAAGVE